MRPHRLAMLCVFLLLILSVFITPTSAAPSSSRSYPPNRRSSPPSPPISPLASFNLSLSIDLSSLPTTPPSSQPIPGNFLGLSLEWCNPLHFIGPDVSHPHTSFYNIFPYLSTRDVRGPTLRVGGSSSDRSWYNPTGRPIPPWKDFVANITDDTYKALEGVSAKFNSSIIAGVSFRYGYNMTIAGPEVQAMVRVLPEGAWGSRWTIEIGNEQELYDNCGTHPYEDYRPCGWGWNNFTEEWDWEMSAVLALLPQSVPEKVIQGGGFCCPSFQSKMADWTIPRASHFSSLSFHRYIWNGCGDNPTLDLFLSDYAGLAGLEKPLEGKVTLASAIAAVRAGTNPPVPVYLGEGNSVGCEGMEGITDTFAQVLWLLDYTLSLASFNVSGMHFYIGWTNPNDFLATPFIYPRYDVDEVEVKPMMYGMWMFAFVTWNNARIITHSRSTPSPVIAAENIDLIKSWSLIDADDSLVMLLVRKDRNSTSPVNVTIQLDVPSGSGVWAGSFITVSAPSITAKTGIVMAGMTWEGTTDGLPRKANSTGADAVYTRVEPQTEKIMKEGGVIVQRLTYTVTVPTTTALAFVIPTSEPGTRAWARRVATILRDTAPSTPPVAAVHSPPVSLASAQVSLASQPVVQSLNGWEWSLSNANGSIALKGCTVPGSVYLDLNQKGILPDLWYRFNPISYEWVGSTEPHWTYSRSVSVSAEMLQTSHQELVLHGVDTIANVSVNGVAVGQTFNQFRRWTFNVTGLLTPTSTVTVTILNPRTYSHQYRQGYPYSFPQSDATWVRKSQSDWGWDWGPAFINVGIFNDVELRGYNAAVIVDLSINHFMYEDLTVDDRTRWGLKGVGDVLVNVTAFLRAGNADVQGTLTVEVTGVTTAPVKTPAMVPGTPAGASGDVVTAVSSVFVVSNGTYELWWPNGYGSHPLYNVTAAFTSQSGELSTKQRRMGFRRVFLRRLPIQGQPGKTMYFEVNGLALFDKGSNLVPATPWHMNETVLQRRSLLGAVEAHQSIIRVWGGGVYETDDTYDFADENGLMMWQEGIFANTLYPVKPDFLANVREEMTQQVRRLTGHPSLAVYCGNNEVEGDILTNGGKDEVNHDHALIDYNELFDDTIRDVVVREVGLYDDGTPHIDYIMSSPANGPASLKPFTWEWGYSRDLSMGDLHYYNYDVDCSVPSNFPQPRHLTEWGWQSYPSFITWQSVTSAEDWQLDSPLMQNRQHHPDGNAQQLAQIQRHFHVPNATDSRTQFDDYVYVSQAVAALCYGTLMGFYRTLRNQAPSYTMGAMYWQTADQWQAPTWSSIEVRGRWKQNHYAVKRAFAPISVTGHVNTTKARGDVLTVYVVTDVVYPVQAVWSIEVRDWSSGAVVSAVNGTSAVPPMHSLLISNVTVDEVIGSCPRTRCFLRLVATVTTSECGDAAMLVENFLFLAPLTNVSLQDPQIKLTTSLVDLASPPSAKAWDRCDVLRPELPVVVSEKSVAGNVTSVTVLVSGSAVAAYVWLETEVEGRWTDNSFTLLPGMDRTVQFMGYDSFDSAAFTATLHVRSIRDTYTRSSRPALVEE